MRIGWLDPGESYPTGEVSTDTLRLLWELCVNHSVNKIRGFRTCRLCSGGRGSWVYATNDRGVRWPLGGSEIVLQAASGIEYRAPQLLAHYIDFHSYLPPREFLEAVDAVGRSRQISLTAIYIDGPHMRAPRDDIPAGAGRSPWLRRLLRGDRTRREYSRPQ